MGVKIWEIEYGWNYETKTVVAATVEEAIQKASDSLKKDYGKNFKKETESYWVRKVECIAESDD